MRAGCNFAWLGFLVFVFVFVVFFLTLQIKQSKNFWKLQDTEGVFVFFFLRATIKCQGKLTLKYTFSFLLSHYMSLSL